MADTVEIAGHRENKWVVYGVAAGGAVVAYLVYRSHRASSAAATSSGTVTDPATGTQYPANAQDPVTGETYAQEIGQYGSVGAADQAVQMESGSYLTNSGDLYGTGYYGGAYSTGTYGSGTTVSGSVYTSNSAWTQAATAGLTDIGYTGTDVATALGLYLTGMPLTTDQAAIVQAAIAEYGPPPVGSFQIIPAPPGSTQTSTVAVPNVVGDTLSDAQSAVQGAGLVFAGPSSGGTVATQSPAAGTQVQPGSTVTVTASAATVAVPNVVGDSQADAGSALQAAGLNLSVSGGTQDPVTAQTPGAGSQVPPGTTVYVTLTAYTPPPPSGGDSGGGGTSAPPPPPSTTPTVSGGHVVSVNNNDAVVAWTGRNATSYQVQLTGPGPENGRVATVGIAQASYSGLSAGHNYTVNVTPIGANGQRGVSGVIAFKTT